MPNSSQYNDSRISADLREVSDRRAITETGLEHLVLKDFMHSSILGVINKSIPYQGYYYDEIPESMTLYTSRGSDYVNDDYFSSGNMAKMILDYQTRLQKPEDELSLIENCIVAFQDELTIEKRQKLKREVILRLEDLTIKIIEHKRVKGEEFKDMISNTRFLDSILNLFTDEGEVSALGVLMNLKKQRQEEIDAIKSKIAYFNDPEFTKHIKSS